jgi:hypothetical protein
MEVGASRLLGVLHRLVMELAFLGPMNKQVGNELGISEIAESTRGGVMRNTIAESLPDVARWPAELCLARAYRTVTPIRESRSGSLERCEETKRRFAAESPFALL